MQISYNGKSRIAVTEKMMQNGLKMNGHAKDVMFQASKLFSTKNNKLTAKFTLSNLANHKRL
jgi:hypothetical protein